MGSLRLSAVSVMTGAGEGRATSITMTPLSSLAISNTSSKIRSINMRRHPARAIRSEKPSTAPPVTAATAIPARIQGPAAI